ncbi:MAG TPA: cytochrome c biogenesis protein ResB [Terriglobales bacterium]
MAGKQSIAKKIWQTIGAIKTGVILLILTVIVAAAGTVILQRPATDIDEIQRAYSPQMLRLLDAVGLTDVFHAWWFVLLLALVSVSIIAASIQRFPNAWRFYSRPYKSPNDSFRKALAIQAQVPVDNEDRALAVAEKAFNEAGWKPERIVRENSFSLFGEKHRISEMAVYIVHASLLLIFVGGIVDALTGWRGYMALTRGSQSNQIELRNGDKRMLPFAVRCNSAGQENYKDGSPKRWWSDLTVIDGGNETYKKQIVVNDPLVYQGVRFYQASYGQTGKVDQLLLTASLTGSSETRDIALDGETPFVLDADTTVRLVEFIPDYTVSDGRVYARSKDIENPAARLVVESKKLGKSFDVWLPPIPEVEHNADAPYQFQPRDVKLAYYTGLEVSHEPGQWAVWSGVVLMGLGLAFVFYLVHVRVWAAPVRQVDGSLVLWIGGTANRNQDVFERRFREVVKEIQSELNSEKGSSTPAEAHSLAGR